MKKTVYTLFAAAMMLSACTTAFLEVEPTTTVPEETSYATEYDMTKALMAAYAPLQVFDFSFGMYEAEYHPYQFISDIMADDYNAVGGSGPGDCPYLQLMGTFRLTPEQSLIQFWSDLYMGVYRSNIVVNRTAEVEGIPEATKTRLISEGLFLRAFYYHILWKFWGSVPYYDVNPNGSSVPYIVPQMSEDDLYKKIIEDLDAATKPGALPDAVMISEVGRATRFAAIMLRADVIMLKGDESRYQSVLAQLKEIIDSGIYALAPDFAEIWSDVGEWNCESIWELNYCDNPSNRTWDDIYAPGGTVFPTFIGPDSYKGSRFSSEGYGFGPVSKELKAAYEPGDLRCDATIMDFNTDKMKNEKYNARQGDTGMFNKKYMGRADGNSNFIGNEGRELNFRTNMRIYRYSDVLLRSAELLLRTGGDKDLADKYYNEVRARAFGTTLDEFGSRVKHASLDNILEERRLEFAFEGNRFFDLVRFGKAEEVLGRKGYSANKRYIPIPQAEIDKAEGTLKQNNY
ncbi:MAG: RagB/SusD family nutrient uptake outer membrane protein [Bacteroidales bacterium]|nr:RagB/SusD family nutrient uptake outer membrane protein [Bacteroidales bacterium]